MKHHPTRHKRLYTVCAAHLLGLSDVKKTNLRGTGVETFDGHAREFACERFCEHAGGFFAGCLIGGIIEGGHAQVTVIPSRQPGRGLLRRAEHAQHPTGGEGLRQGKGKQRLKKRFHVRRMMAMGSSVMARRAGIRLATGLSNKVTRATSAKSRSCMSTGRCDRK